MSKLVLIHSGHNSTVIFYENGICKYILHEEKFTFLKNYTGFPNNAFDYLSKKINFDNVDKFIFTSKFFTSQHWSFEGDDILTKSEKKFMQIRNIYEFFEMNFNYFGSFITRNQIC